jgi:hypothetical protein
MLERTMFKKLTAIALTLIMALTVLVGCGGSDGGTLANGAPAEVSIPDEYKAIIVVNHFRNTWPEANDGSDLKGSVQFKPGDEGFTTINKYLEGVKLVESDHAGNFVPDFFFFFSYPKLSSYGFRFFGNELIMSDPSQECYKVELSTGDFNALKDYIAQTRTGNSAPTEPGAYTSNRATTAEEREMFQAVMADKQKDVSYEAVAVATQVEESGINYCFTCTVTPDISEPEPYDAFVYVFKGSNGEAPKLIDVTTEKKEQ